MTRQGAAIDSGRKPRHVGIVTYWNGANGYGFVSPADGAREVFMHRSAIDGGGELREGQAVTFEMARYENALRAVRVRRALEAGERTLSRERA